MFLDIKNRATSEDWHGVKAGYPKKPSFFVGFNDNQTKPEPVGLYTIKYVSSLPGSHSTSRYPSSPISVQLPTSPSAPIPCHLVRISIAVTSGEGETDRRRGGLMICRNQRCAEKDVFALVFPWEKIPKARWQEFLRRALLFFSSSKHFNMIQWGCPTAARFKMALAGNLLETLKKAPLT